MGAGPAEGVVALDVGTSGARSAWFDLAGRPRPGTVVRCGYRPRMSAPGMVEIAPSAVLRAVRACLVETLARCAGTRVVAVGGACFWHSLLGVDARGRPVTPIYTWADARAAPDAARLRARLEGRAVHRRTGCVLHASYWPAKLRWLRRTAPERFSAARWWLSPAEWLYWRLAGVRACSHSMASGTGLYDPSRRNWDPEMLRAGAIRAAALLPLDDRPAAPAPRRPGGALAALGQAPWVPALGDGAASNLGSGAVGAGLVAVNLGSSAAVRVVERGGRAIAPAGLFAYRVDEARHLVGGAVSNAGNLRAWARRVLRLPADEAALERALARRPGPVEGLTVLPFWNAERAPSWRDDLRGCIDGLTGSTTALDLAQALVEAGHQRLAEVLERLARHRAIAEIRVSGAGARSGSGLRRLADVLGRDLHASPEADATLRGAAIAALERLGLTPAAVPAGRRVRHDPARARAYAAARERQRALERLRFG